MAVDQRRLRLVVQDVVVHTGCLAGLLMAAVGGEVVPEIAIEALNDIQVAKSGAGTARKRSKRYSRTWTKR